MASEARLFPLLQFPPLQISYFKQDDPLGAILLLVGVGALVTFGVVAGILKNGIRTGGPVGNGGGKAATPRQFSAFNLNRLIRPYGFNKDQKKMLEYVFRDNGVTDPERILKSPDLLDRYFKRVYKKIESSEAPDAEIRQKTALLFSVRNTLEYSQNFASSPPPAQQLSPNTAAVLVSRNVNYPVRVASSKGNQIEVELPQDTQKSPVRLNQGAKATLSFFTKSSQGFSFDCQIAEFITSPRGPKLQLIHSGQAKPLIQRRFRRKQAETACTYFMVRLEEQGKGRKKTQKMILEGKSHDGTILDISIGGCAIKSSSAVNPGSRLKIELEYAAQKARITVLGQVLRINKSGAVGAIMHTKFLKIPWRSLNTINALVYGYGEEDQRGITNGGDDEDY